MDDNVTDFMAYRARAARAIAIGLNGKSPFNERDTQALAEHVRHVEVLYSQFIDDIVRGDDYDPDTWEVAGRASANIIEIGRRWAECKCIAEGNFVAWFYREFGWSESQADVFIRAYKLSLEHEIVAELSAEAILMIARSDTPETARMEVIQRTEAGEMLSDSDASSIIGHAERRLGTKTPVRNRKSRRS